MNEKRISGNDDFFVAFRPSSVAAASHQAKPDDSWEARPSRRPGRQENQEMQERLEGGAEAARQGDEHFAEDHWVEDCAGWLTLPLWVG